MDQTGPILDVYDDDDDDNNSTRKLASKPWRGV